MAIRRYLKTINEELVAFDCVRSIIPYGDKVEEGLFQLCDEHRTPLGIVRAPIEKFVKKEEPGD